MKDADLRDARYLGDSRTSG